MELGKVQSKPQLVQDSTLDNMDSYHLSMKLTFEACKYMKMKAHRNHYRVIGENHANTMATYDGVEWPWFSSKNKEQMKGLHLGSFNTWEYSKI